MVCIFIYMYVIYNLYDLEGLFQHKWFYEIQSEN